MQHSKAHAALIHAVALLACLAVLIPIVSSVPSVTHAESSTVVNSPSSPSPQSTQGNTTGSGCTGQTICNPLKYNTLDSLLSAVLAAAIQLGTIVLTIAIVVVGFRFVAARGNEEKIRSARTALMWTVIGGLILLGATAIQSVITTTVNNITT